MSIKTFGDGEIGGKSEPLIENETLLGELGLISQENSLESWILKWRLTHYSQAGAWLSKMAITGHWQAKKKKDFK